MSKTKKNHYIPKFYIAKWKLNDDKQVWCLKKDENGEDKIFKTNTENILVDRIWEDRVEKAFAQIENNL